MTIVELPIRHPCEGRNPVTSPVGGKVNAIEKTPLSHTLLQVAQDHSPRRDRRGRLGHASQRHLAPLPRPEPGRIAVKVINHLWDEVMKVFRVG